MRPSSCAPCGAARGGIWFKLHRYGRPWDAGVRHKVLHPTDLRAILRMWKTRSVRLNVRLPDDVSVQAEELQESDPDLMSWVVQYGLTRRSIYQEMRQAESDSASPAAARLG